jgi:uncharacterized protein YbdZ (MbtH family)
MSVSDSETVDTTVYNVVLNHEEQYSIWPMHKDIPRGWKQAGKQGTKDECLAHIREVWTDMRPLSLRKKMEELAKTPPAPVSAPPAELGKNLVDRLCEGDHVVEVGLRPGETLKQFKESIDRNYIHLKFTATKGGTNLGFHLDKGSSDFGSADFENGKGTVHIEGSLTLDYVKVRCVADIELSTLAGRGHLVRVETGEMSAA